MKLETEAETDRIDLYLGAGLELAVADLLAERVDDPERDFGPEVRDQQRLGVHQQGTPSEPDQRSREQRESEGRGEVAPPQGRRGRGRCRRGSSRLGVRRRRRGSRGSWRSRRRASRRRSWPSP